MNKQLKQTLEKCNVLKKVEIYSKSYGYITTLILPISGTFEAVGTGGCNVHFYGFNKESTHTNHGIEPQAVAVSPYGWLMTHYSFYGGGVSYGGLRRIGE